MRRVKSPGVELDVKMKVRVKSVGVAHGFPESSHSIKRPSATTCCGWVASARSDPGVCEFKCSVRNFCLQPGDVLADDVIALLNDIDADDDHHRSRLGDRRRVGRVTAAVEPHRCECSCPPCWFIRLRILGVARRQFSIPL